MTDSLPPPADDEDAAPPEGEDPAGRLEPSTDGAVEGDEVLEGEVADDRRLSGPPRAFSGPLPPPDVLEEYEQVLPGLKHDIVNQWKAETAHRHQTIDGVRGTDEAAMRAYYDGEKRGQYLGFVILIGVLVIAGLSILFDQPIVGIASLLAAGGGAVWALRRSSLGNAIAAPRDLGEGDEVEGLPPGSSEDDRSQPDR